VWDGARRQEVAQAFTATRASFAPDVLRRVESRLDGYTAAWVAEHRSACEANVAGHQTSRLLDLRMACLGRRKVHVAALVDVFATADPSVVENAVQAVASLPSLQACADAEAVQAVAPPSDPQTAQRVDQLRLQLAQAEAHEDTGRYAQGLVLAQKVRGEAAALGYGPLDAEAALGEGSLLMTVGRGAEAEAALVRAMQVAIVHDQHAIAAEAAAKRIFVMATGLGQAPAALVTRPVAEALVQRAQGEARLAALLHNNLGVAYAVAQEYDLSATQFERTIALLSSAEGPPDPLIAATHYNLGNLYVEQGRPEKARAPFLTAVELFTKFVGDHHPQVAWPLDGLGDVALKAGSYAEAERFYGDALALMESALGPMNPYMVDPLLGLSRVYAKTGRVTEAIAMYRRAVAVGEGSRANEPVFAEILEELGELLAGAGEHAEARRLFERSVEVTTAALGRDTEKQARAALHAGEMAEKLGDRAAAITWYERVLAVAPGARPEERSTAAVGLARALADKSEATGRVCDLLVEARLSLKSTDPLLDEVNALQTRRCVAPAD
jgi:tetratricopeptide (TPR) repeat protein